MVPMTLGITDLIVYGREGKMVCEILRIENNYKLHKQLQITKKKICVFL